MKKDHIVATGELTISVTDFKTRCLDLLSRLADRRLSHVTVTRHGKPVAEIYPPATSDDAARQLFGFMRGTVQWHGAVDLTQPVIDMADWSPELPS